MLFENRNKNNKRMKVFRNSSVFLLFFILSSMCFLQGIEVRAGTKSVFSSSNGFSMSNTFWGTYAGTLNGSTAGKADGGEARSDGYYQAINRYIDSGRLWNLDSSYTVTMSFNGWPGTYDFYTMDNTNTWTKLGSTTVTTKGGIKTVSISGSSLPRNTRYFNGYSPGRSNGSNPSAYLDIIELNISRTDNELPGLTLTQSTTSQTNGNVVINASASDGISGVKSITLPNGSTVNGSSASYTATANGTYSFTVYDNFDNATTRSISITNIDKSLPTLSLSQSITGWTNGNVIITASAGDVGSGVRDIKLPSGVTVAGSYTTYTVSSNGTYSFQVTDNVGNITTQSISITNIDKTAPSLSLTKNPTGWTNGSITITATGSDTGGSSVKSIKLPNGSIVNGSSANYSVATNGTYTFEVLDNAGNSTSQSISITNYENVSPSISISNNDTWTNGASVPVTIASSDSLSGINNVRYSLSGATSLGSTVYSSAFNVTAEGITNISATATDNAGNSSTDTSVVRIDRTAPTATLTASPTAYTNGNVTLTINVSDSLSGIREIRKADSTVVTGVTSTTQTVTSNGTYTFRVTDNCGNYRDVSVNVSNIDRTMTGLSLTQTPNTWTNGSVTINAVASDNQSGVKQIKLPNGSIVGGANASYTVTSNGIYTFEASDNLGNNRIETIDIDNIDKISPVVNSTINPSSWTNGNVVISVTATDVMSGVKEIILPNSTKVVGATANYTVTSNGDYSFVVTDNAGNSATKVVSVNTIDVTLPVITLTPSTTAWTSGNITITAGATDSQSGIKEIKLPNGTITTGNSAIFTVTGNGTYTFEAVDNVGNRATKSITISNKDNVVPTLNLSNTPATWTNGDVVITATGSDVGGSGVKEITLPNGTILSGSTATYTVSTNGTYSFEISDVVGNEFTKSITISNIDKALPEMTLTANTTGNTNGDIVITANATDLGSGVKRIKLPDNTYVNASTANYTVGTNGTFTFVAEDNTGNITTKSITVGNIDKVSPVANYSLSNLAWTNQDVVISVTATDNMAGVRDIKLPNNSIVTGATASYTVSSNGNYSFLVTDNVGNTTTVTVPVTNIDKTLPGMTLTQNLSSWTSGNVIINVSTTDGQSGVKDIKLPNGNIVSVNTSSYTVSANGTYSFEVTDVAGNKTTKAITISNIDTTGASITLTPSTTSWTNKDIVISVSSTDSQSGVKDIKLPNGTIITGSTATFTVSSNGTYSFEVTDIVGNKSTQSITVSNIDKVAPSLDLSANTLITNLTVTISANAFDGQSGIKAIKLPNGQIVNDEVATYTVSTNGTYSFEVEDIAGNKVSSSITVGNIIVINPVSGINRTEYKLEGATVQDWTVYSGPFNVTNEGITSIRARVIDNAGNVSNEATSIVKIDRSKPLNGTVEIIVK